MESNHVLLIGDDQTAAPIKNGIFRVIMPDVPSAGENLQTLLNAHFRSTEMIQCRNIMCDMRVTKSTTLELVDPKSAIVIRLLRERDDPQWTQPGLALLSPEEQAHYPGHMIYRKVAISDQIKILRQKIMPFFHNFFQTSQLIPHLFVKLMF